MKSRLPRKHPRRKLALSSCDRCVIRGGLRTSGLGERAIDEVCNRLKLRHVRRRQTLYVEGNVAGNLYALRKGRVKISKVDAGGREHIVAIHRPGALLGVEAVFKHAYAGTAEFLDKGEVCVGTRAAIEDVMDGVPGFALSLARYVHLQLERAWAHQACLGAVGARARLAAYLLQQSAGADDPDTIPHDLTQSELGAILGISAETVCRVLATFRSDGILETRPGAIGIRDRDALERAAHA